MLVVGASSGIGREIAIQASHAGAKVALCARRPELLDAAVAECLLPGSRDSGSRLAGSRLAGSRLAGSRLAGSRDSWARAFRCDVTDESDVSRSVEEASSWMGGLDVVVYAAGTAPLGRVAELEASEWSAMLATNVTGAALVVRHALGALRSARDGTVAFLSTHTVGVPWPSLVAYSSSKAALEEMARGLRLEEPALRVLSIRVGNTLTSFADGWEPERFEAAFSGWIDAGLMRHSVMSAHDVAEQILEAVADKDAPVEMLVCGDEEVFS